MSYIPAAGGFNTKVTITSSTSWTCPAGVYWIWLIIWGSGGGGYLLTDGSSYSNSGGGGGGQVRQILMPVVPGTTYWFLIPAGGAGYGNVSNVGGTASNGSNAYMYSLASQGTLSAAITVNNGAQFINLGNVTGLSAGSIIQVASEQMMVLSPGTAGGGNTWVVRNWNNTSGTTYSNGTAVNLMTFYAFALGGAAGGSAFGGNGGGFDGLTGGGANASAGAGSGKAAQNGGLLSGGGGGAASGGAIYGAGDGPGPLGHSFPAWQMSAGSLSPEVAAGGGSWGPGGIGGALGAGSFTPALANTGGGGGGGGNGGSGGAILAYSS